MNPLTPIQKSVNPARLPRRAPENVRVGLMPVPRIRELPPTVVPLRKEPGKVPATPRAIGSIQPGGVSSREGVRTLKMK